MSANVEAMVREGIAALKGGKKEEGRILLTKAVELDPYNEEGWLWLSGVVEGQDDQRTCLENVLAINPANDKARKGLDFLSGKPIAPANPAPPPEPVQAASVTSVEWDFGATETSSASSSRSVPEPSPQDYDDWVSGLGLKADTDEASESPVVASPFVDFDDDFFNAGPFDEAEDVVDTATATENTIPRPVVSAATPQNIPYTPPPTDFDDDIPPFPSSVSEPEPIPASKDGKRRGGSKTVDDGLGVPIAVAATATMPVPLETEDNFDDFGIAAEIFPMIPKSIAATRLPGTNERPPLLLVLLSLLLIIGNVALAITVAMKLINPA